MSGLRPAPPGTPAPPGKPPEVEEWIDEYFHRPLAALLVRALVRTSITPNQVTLISALLGVASGYAMTRGIASPRWMLAAALLLVLAVVFDCADGQLARARRISSTTGAMIDGIADNVVGVSVALGAGWLLVVTSGDWRYAALVAGGMVSISVQTGLFDDVKARYIARTGSGYAEREADLDKLERERRLAWSERRYSQAILLRAYIGYTRLQGRTAPIAPAPDPVAWRAANRARMHAWTWLGSGTHFALGYLAIGASCWWPPALAGYFLLQLTGFNLLLAALLWWERRARAS